MKKLLMLSALIASQTLIAQDMKVGQLSNIQRLTNDNVKYENPQWSPNGSKIAFTEYGYNKLYVMNDKGTDKVQLSDGRGVGFMYQWSADSYQILVRDLRYERVGTQTQRRQAAWAIDLQGQKTRMTEDVARMEPAAWRYSAQGDVTVMALDAKVISSNKRKIKRAAQAVKLNDNANISVIVNKDGLSVVNAAGEKKLLNSKPSFCPSISPDGTKIAFVEGNDVYIINVDGTGKKKMTRGFNPTWVNNSQIIFENSTDDGHTYTSSDLYIMNINGTNLKALTTTSDCMEMCPSVSPDGKRLVFTSFTDGQIYSADLK